MVYHSHLFRTTFAAFIFVAILQPADVSRPPDYFQQEVAYRIDVTLADSNHTLSAFLSLDYINHSPDTLEFIWFHLWPNAYKNPETAFGQEVLLLGKSRFYYAKDEQRGYIDSLDFRTGDVPLQWEYHPEWIDVAKVHLAEPLPPEGSVTIETPFFVKIPDQFSRMGHTGRHYEISQWYPKPAVYDREGWHAMPYMEMGEFYSEFGTFDVRITLPREYVVMATGDLPEGDPEYAFIDSLAAVTAEYYALKTEEDEPDKKARKKWRKEFEEREFSEPGEDTTKTLHFHQERVHDFAWFADKRYMVQQDTLWVEDSTRAITLWAMHLPKYAEAWKDAIEYLHDATYWYGRWHGTYPYNHVTAVSSDVTAGYGMEYPNITIIAIAGHEYMMENVLVHEVGHNWHYGIYGFNEREHVWLDEGINAYADTRYQYAKYGEENGGQFSYLPPKLNEALSRPFTILDMHYLMANAAMGAHDDIPITSDFTRVSLFSYAAMIQDKSPMTYYHMAEYLGERNQEVWDAFTETWSFAHPGPTDVRHTFETVADEDLSWFFDDLITTIKPLDYGVTKVESQGETVGVHVTNFGEIAAPVKVATLDKKGEVLSARWIPGFAGSTTVSFPSENVHTATTDPDRMTVDVKHSNDQPPILKMGGMYLHKPALRLFYSAPEPGRTQLFYLPMLYGTAYSGPLLGAVFYRDVAPPMKNRFTSGLYYSFKRERLVGGFRLAMNRYRIGAADKVSGTIRYSDYAEYRAMSLGGEAVFRKRAVSSPAAALGLRVASYDLTDGALDSLWSTGSFNNLTFTARAWDNSDALLDWDINAQLRAITGQPDDVAGDLQATVLQAAAKANYRYSRRGRIYLRGWFGHTFADELDMIPEQYRFWLSGGLDTELEHPSAINRSGEGALAVYHQYFLPEGPGLRAFTTTQPGQTALALNLDVTTRLPLDPFMDIAATDNGVDGSWQTYMDFGLTLSLGPLKIIVPLWAIMGDDDTGPAYEDWRIGIRFPRLFSDF
jgi:hypothetical protein